MARYDAKNVDKIDVLMDSCAVCSMMVGGPGGATNADTDPDQFDLLRRPSWL